MNWKRMSIVVGLLLAAALLIGACSGMENPDLDLTNEEPNGEELDQEAILALVKADLADRKGVEIEEIGHPSVEQKTWSTSALGCPEEGTVYADVITSGYQIILSIGGPASIEQFDYRTDTLGNFILCEG